MVIETLAFAGISIAGQTIFGRVITDTYTLVRDTTTHPVVNSVLAELDLTSNLIVIEALINQVETERLNKDDPLSICLHQVNSMVHRIKEELEEIKEELVNHEKKWMSSWRTPNYDGPLRRLSGHKKILDKRVEMLIELIKLHKH